MRVTVKKALEVWATDILKRGEERAHPHFDEVYSAYRHLQNRMQTGGFIETDSILKSDRDIVELARKILR